MHERLKDSTLSYPDNIAVTIGISTEITDEIRQKTIKMVENSAILSDKELRCLIAYFKDNRTYADIAKEYDVSPERIRQIIVKAIFTLRRNKSKYFPPFRCLIRLSKNNKHLGYIALDKKHHSPSLVDKQGYATIFYHQEIANDWIKFIKAIYNDSNALHVEIIIIH